MSDSSPAPGVRNRIFHAAVRDLYEAASAVMAAPSSLPHGVSWQWREEEGGLVKQVKSLEPNMNLWARREDQLKRLEAWKRLRKAFQSEEILSSHYDHDVGVGMTRNRLNEEHLFRNLLFFFWRKAGEILFSEDVLQTLYPQVEDFFYLDTIGMRIVVPLQNLDIGQTLVLAEGVTLQVLEPALAARIEPAYMEPVEGDLKRPASRSALFVKLRLSKAVGAVQPVDVWPALDLRVEEYMRAALATFDTIAPARIIAPCALAEYTSWAPIGGGVSRTFDHAARPPGPRVQISSEDVPGLAEFWRASYEVVVAGRRPPPEPMAPIKSPRTPYAVIYRVHTTVEAKLSELALDVRLTFWPDGIKLPILEPRQFLGPGVSTLTMEVVSKELPATEAPYLIIETFVPRDQPGVDSYNAARLVVAEAASILDLRYPGLLVTKSYEGPVGRSVWAPEGPLRMTARHPVAPRDVLSSFHTDLLAVAKLDDEFRRRFQLAARWYTRGVRTRNPVDKLLYYYTALEVHPASGTSDVVRSVAEYLMKYLPIKLDINSLKQRLGLIGRWSIVDLRQKIVHDGMPYVPRDLADAWSAALVRLEAIVTTCLRLLAGLEPGDELNTYLED